jgi:hypothetical protein
MCNCSDYATICNHRYTYTVAAPNGEVRTYLNVVFAVGFAQEFVTYRAPAVITVRKLH